MPPIKIKEAGKKLLPVVKLESNVIVIVARRRIEDNVPELFFMAGASNSRYLMCYERVGQHSEASMNYYLNMTRSTSIEEPDVLALVNEWINLPPIQPFELHTGFAPWGRKIA